MGYFYAGFYRKQALLLALVSLGSYPGFAQIMDLSPARLKAETRKSQKEAASYQADHKETHLEIHPLYLQKEKASRRRRASPESRRFLYDKDINAIYEEPRGLGKRKKSRKE